ncbi:hypothetical protein [Wenxinia saemankumensis]|uniref:Uncharacterized protein n=1 Tax=Wenxinia saemankumensis TaxID=1447782 RepID=A0A1M6FWR9_9RHOB|nr:hypothetical protein [Wenxinia saemankumensis]SHJ02114.1 hypothetical protein SAMN05444417_2544 [Wenxinia saemankumensis]
MTGEVPKPGPRCRVGLAAFSYVYGIALLVFALSGGVLPEGWGAIAAMVLTVLGLPLSLLGGPWAAMLAPFAVLVALNVLCRMRR